MSLAVTHTPWVPERVESFNRLMGQIGENGWSDVAVFNERALNHVWSRKMWEWAAGTDTQWCVFLQDDAIVAPGFYYALEYVLACTDDETEVIGLQAPHPAASVIAAQGTAEWFTTTDGLVGVGYVVRRSALVAFLNWRAALPPGVVEEVSEDTLLGVWCAISGRDVYHPVPTLVDHDTSVPSTYDNASHPNRRSAVRWDTPVKAYPLYSPPHLGRFYESTAQTARKCGASDEVISRINADTGAEAKRRLHYIRRAYAPPPTNRLFVATPSTGAVKPQYAASVWSLLREPSIEVDDSFEVVDVQQWSQDVDKARSHFLAYFLNQTDATHILFVDGDVGFTPACIRGMLASGHDFVAAPYPRRDGIDWKRVRALPDIPAEAAAYRYSVRLLDSYDPKVGMVIDGADCAEVEAVPFGCVLLSRAGVERMCNAYASALTFRDPGKPVAVGLFQRPISAGQRWTSEDYSYCERWRDIGGKVHLYLGQGSPVDHYGEWGYRGAIEAFGLRRVPA